MRCWYFLFEGKGRFESGDHKLEHLYSSALVPRSDRELAIKLLIENLSEYGVELVEIEDDFLFDPDEYDMNSINNIGWNSWYEEVEKSRETIFTPWQIFPEEN